MSRLFEAVASDHTLHLLSEMAQDRRYEGIAAAYWSSEDEMNEAIDQALAYFLAGAARLQSSE